MDTRLLLVAEGGRAAMTVSMLSDGGPGKRTGPLLGQEAQWAQTVPLFQPGIVVFVRSRREWCTASQFVDAAANLPEPFEVRPMGGNPRQDAPGGSDHFASDLDEQGLPRG